MSTPAAEVRSFAATIPANTPANTPVTIQLTMPPRVVTSIHWRVPPGPSGLMGWRLTMSNGVAVIPTGGGYIITDDDHDTWPVTGQPDSGYWELSGYNTDIYQHTVYLDFLLDLISGVSTPPQQVANTVISQTTPITAGALAPITAGITGPLMTISGLTVVPSTTPYLTGVST